MVTEGKKIKLRGYIMDDYDQLRYWLKGDQEWKKLDAPYFKKLTDEEVEASILKQIEADKIPDVFPTSMVIADIESNRLIGEVTRYWICKKTRWPAMGVLIYDPGNWGKGYATEAIRIWEQIVWDGLPDSWRIDIETWSGNGGMMKVAEKLGYKLEGRFTKARKVGEIFYDDLQYGKLRD